MLRCLLIHGVGGAGEGHLVCYPDTGWISLDLSSLLCHEYPQSLHGVTKGNLCLNIPFKNEH